MGVSLIGFCAHIKNKKLNKNLNDLTDKHVQCESKKSHLRFSEIFSQTVGNF